MAAPKKTAEKPAQETAKATPSGLGDAPTPKKGGAGPKTTKIGNGLTRVDY